MIVLVHKILLRMLISEDLIVVAAGNIKVNRWEGYSYTIQGL